MWFYDKTPNIFSTFWLCITIHRYQLFRVSPHIYSFNNNYRAVNRLGWRSIVSLYIRIWRWTVQIFSGVNRPRRWNVWQSLHMIVTSPTSFYLACLGPRAGAYFTPCTGVESVLIRCIKNVVIPFPTQPPCFLSIINEPNICIDETFISTFPFGFDIPLLII